MSDQEQRRSSRTNAGIPPDRLGEWEPAAGHDAPLTPVSNRSVAASKSAASSSSATRRRLLRAQARLEAAKKIQVLEEQELARKKTLVDLELKAALAEIADATSRAGSSVRSGLPGAAGSNTSGSVALQPVLATAVHTSKVARVEEWVRTQGVFYVPDQTPSVATAQSACAALASVSSTRELFAQRRTQPGILHQPASQYVASPAVRQSAPASAVRQSAPAPAVGQSAPAPAVRQSAPAPAVGQSAPAPVVRQSAPAPAVGQSVPGPVARLNAEAAPFVTVPMTSLGDSPGARELHLQQQLDRTRSELVMTEQALHQTLGQVTQASPLTARAPPAPPERQPASTNKFLARQTMGRDLPTFSGQPEEWPLFFNVYHSTTTACEFTDAENLIRLQKCLRDKAKEAVVGLLTVPGNVDQVLRTLELRFGRAELVISTLIHKAKSLSSIRADDFDALMVFATAVQTLVSTMQLLRTPGHMLNPQLRQELVSKLPASLRLQWGDIVRSMPPDDVSIATLSSWLQQVALSASYIHIPRPSATDHRPPPRRTDPSLATTTSSSGSSDRCDFCNGRSHATTECRKFLGQSVRSRWKWVKEQRRCFTCLRKGHRLPDCPRPTECPVHGCSKRHHKLLHSDASDTAGERDETHLCAVTEQTGEVMLRVAPVTLHGPAGDVRVCALFDEAWTVTLVDSSLATEVGATGTVTPLTLSWTDTQRQRHPKSLCVDLEISGDSGELHPLLGARTVTNLRLPCFVTSVDRVRKSWTHLAHVPVSKLHERPRPLIGQDNINLTISREVVEGPPNAPVASRTLLGWVVHGHFGSHRSRVNEHFTLVHSTSADDELHDLVKDSFRTDNFGVQVTTSSLLSEREKRAQHIQVATTQGSSCGTRWETGLLWKEDNTTMPSSKAAAMTRLLSLERKMVRQPEFARQYSTKLEQYVAKGYAEKLTPELAAHEPPAAWYLPHFGVTNPNKPGKLRLVFDAASKTGGRSLNEALLSGPDLLRPLPTVLFGFRERRIAFGADIAEMFHQVQIREADRDSQRFLWRTDLSQPPDVFRMKSMTFGATSSPSSAMFVKNHNAHSHPQTSPRLQTAIVERHYMDDYFDSTDTVEKATALSADVIRIHKDGGFVIRHWISNSPAVLASVPEALRANTTTVGLDVEHAHAVERTLGLRWDTATDTL